MEEGYETIYYLEAENGRRKFAVVKFSPRIVRYLNFKAIRSGNFQFVVSDETKLVPILEQLEKKLKLIVRNRSRRAKVLDAIFDVLAEILIDGLTFELTVEEALYLANLLKRHVDEDYDAIRQTRNDMMLMETLRLDDWDPAVH